VSRRVSICVSLLAVVLGASCGTCNVRPLVVSISPAQSNTRSSQLVLVVNGDNFLPGSKVSWNGFFVPTTFVSSHELTAEIPGSDLASPGTVVVFVFNPEGSSTFVFGFFSNNGCGGNSNGVTFALTP
jgi:hypothetical protein